ncbi:MAG: HAMP domain-containing sensor histidine kinase [Ginsengibacter sp.]
MAYPNLTNKFKVRPLRIIYVFYWFLLTYILAALIFWYIALNNQNQQLTNFKLQAISVTDMQLPQKQNEIQLENKRKNEQYIGEGVTFLLLILTGAVLVFRLINKQLIQSQQQQNFMMAITHELKTPIAVTRLNLETMQMRKLEYSQQQKLIRNTIQEANRLNALCNNMLLLSQINSGGYTVTNEKFDLATLANDCAEDFITRFPERKIEIDAPDEIMITGDKLLLQLAINNLLDNAIKYSGKDGMVIIRTFRDNEKMVLQVMDDGSGISDDEKKKIFDKYFRGAQMQTKGTGLGLYLSKKIVTQYHGDISVKNNNPQGCIFEIKFKLSKN